MQIGYLHKGKSSPSDQFVHARYSSTQAVSLFTANRARHWINARNRDDLNLRNGAEHFVGDRGRADFSDRDSDERCVDIDDKSEACSILETRKDCPWSCGIYLDSAFYQEGFHGPGLLE